MGARTIITSFYSPNLSQETWEAQIAHFLSSRFLYLGIWSLCITLTSTWRMPGSFKYGFFGVFGLVVCFWCFFFSSERRQPASCDDALGCVSGDSLSVIAAFLFWHKHTQTFLPNSRCAEALLMTPNQPFPATIPSSASPGCNMTVELAFLQTCILSM